MKQELSNGNDQKQEDAIKKVDIEGHEGIKILIEVFTKPLPNPTNGLDKPANNGSLNAPK